MPTIDLRIALTNPMTLDTFDVIRRMDTQNAEGETVLPSTTFNNVRGVVTPATSFDVIQRLADEQLADKAIEIYTRFAARGASEERANSQGFQPDLIVWAEDTYLVRFIDDYSRYAAGFMRIVATITTPLPEASVTR